MQLTDLVDRTEATKDSAIELQLLSRMFELYDHVSKYGIDRTFVSLYNRHGELDKTCGIQFPACESMSPHGDKYSYYSTRFLAAMEDKKEGLWPRFKVSVARLWNKAKEAFGFRGTAQAKKELAELIAQLKKVHSSKDVVTCSGVLAKLVTDKQYLDTLLSSISDQCKKLSQTVSLINRLLNAFVSAAPLDTLLPLDDADKLADKTNELTMQLRISLADYKKISKRTFSYFRQIASAKPVKTTVDVAVTKVMQFHSKIDTASDKLRANFAELNHSIAILEKYTKNITDTLDLYRTRGVHIAISKIAFNLNYMLDDVEKLRNNVLTSMSKVRHAIAKLAGVSYKD